MQNRRKWKRKSTSEGREGKTGLYLFVIVICIHICIIHFMSE